MEERSHERRIRRSMSTRTATRFYLDNVTERHGLAAMVFANAKGEFILGSEVRLFGNARLIGAVNEEYGRKLAKIAPFAAADLEAGSENAWKGRDDERIFAKRLNISNGEFFIAFVGNADKAEMAYQDAVEGVIRIQAGEQVAA